MWVRDLTFFFSLNSWCTPNCHRPEHREADKQANICDEHVHRIGHGHGCRVRERALSALKMMAFFSLAAAVIYSSSTIHNSTTPIMYSILELNNVCTFNITFEDAVQVRASKASHPSLTSM